MSLSTVFDYRTAPLVQWEPAIGEPPSEGKQQEDVIIYPAIAQAVQGARAVTGLIADEGRLELYLADKCPSIGSITHLTLKGAFEKAARHNLGDHAKVRLSTDVEEIAPGSQDVVVMNMILGCVSQGGDVRNMKALATFSKACVKPDGEKIIVVRPNPAGGAFDTYKCTTSVKELKAGEDFGFVVKGLEQLGEMKNAYTPSSFLGKMFGDEGVVLGRTKPIGNRWVARAPFLMNVITLQKR